MEIPQSNTNGNCDEYESEEYDDYYEDEENFDMEDKEMAGEINDKDDFKPYNYHNTVDKIFKTEKKPKNTSEHNPARFEDADWWLKIEECDAFI